MKEHKYSINLFLKDDENTEMGALEFSKALELPKKLFPETFHFMSLLYDEEEIEIAEQHCLQLNKEIQTIGYAHVEFRIREIKVK